MRVFMYLVIFLVIHKCAIPYINLLLFNVMYTFIHCLKVIYQQNYYLLQIISLEF